MMEMLTVYFCGLHTAQELSENMLKQMVPNYTLQNKTKKKAK